MSKLKMQLWRFTWRITETGDMFTQDVAGFSKYHAKQNWRRHWQNMVREDDGTEVVPSGASLHMLTIEHVGEYHAANA